MAPLIATVTATRREGRPSPPWVSASPQSPGWQQGAASGGAAPPGGSPCHVPPPPTSHTPRGLGGWGTSLSASRPRLRRGPPTTCPALPQRAEEGAAGGRTLGCGRAPGALQVQGTRASPPQTCLHWASQGLTGHGPARRSRDRKKRPADAGERPAAQGCSPSPRPGPQAVLCLQAAPRWAAARPRETRLDPGWTRASACTAGKRVPTGPAALAHGRRRCTCRRAPARRVLPTWTRQPGRRPVASSGPDSSQTS